MKVWLIDHASGIPSDDVSEGRLVRRGIQRNLSNWFRSVARHRNAVRNRPGDQARSIDVAWAAAGTSAGAYDLVLHFVPSQPGENPPVMGPYREAALQLRNRELAESLSGRTRGYSGGKTIAAMEGRRRVPTLSMVIVLYDAQYPHESTRVSNNVENLSVIAFHEAAHNKDRSNSLHTHGGGGIFGDVHTTGRGTASGPNRDNIAFMANIIWNWGPQYIVGGSLAPQAPP